MAIGNATRGESKNLKYLVQGFTHYKGRLVSKVESLKGKNLSEITTPHFALNKEFIINKPEQGDMTDAGYAKALSAWKQHLNLYGEYKAKLTDNKLASLEKLEAKQKSRRDNGKYGRLSYPFAKVTDISGELVSIHTYMDEIDGQDTPKVVLQMVDVPNKERYTIEMTYTKISRAIIDALLGLEDPTAMLKITLRMGVDEDTKKPLLDSKDRPKFYGEVYADFKNEGGLYKWGNRALRAFDESREVLDDNGKPVYEDGAKQYINVSQRPKDEVNKFLRAMEFAYEGSSTKINVFLSGLINNELEPKVQKFVEDKYTKQGWNVAYKRYEFKNITYVTCLISKEIDDDSESTLNDSYNADSVDEHKSNESNDNTEDNDLPF